MWRYLVLVFASLYFVHGDSYADNMIFTVFNRFVRETELIKDFNFHS